MRRVSPSSNTTWLMRLALCSVAASLALSVRADEATHQRVNQELRQEIAELHQSIDSLRQEIQMLRSQPISYLVTPIYPPYPPYITPYPPYPMPYPMPPMPYPLYGTMPAPPMLVPPPSAPTNYEQIPRQHQEPLPIPSPMSGPPPKAPRQVIIQPRSRAELKARNFPLPNGETVVVVSGGIILSVNISPDTKSIVDIEADRLVFWTRGDFSQTLNGDGSTSDEGNKTPEEFYLSGNVELRNQSPKETQLIRADEVYFHAGKNFALALNADIVPKTNLWTPWSTLFGSPIIDPKTGLPEQQMQRIIEGRHFVEY